MQARLVLACMFTLGLVDSIQRSMKGPFVRSLVSCDADIVAERGAPEWSGSSHCGDKEIVLSTAQHLESTLNSVGLLCGMFAGPLFGAAADRYSRRVVIWFGIALHGVSLSLLLFAARQADAVRHAYPLPREASVLQTPLLFLMSMVGGAATTTGPLIALLTDSTPPKQRAAMFSIQVVVGGVASAISQVVSIVTLLLSLESYVVVYALLVSAVPLPALPLLLVKDRAVDDTTTANREPHDVSDCVGAARTLVLSMRSLLAASAFLRAYCLSTALIVSGVVGPVSLLSPSLMAIYDFSQGARP